VEGRHEIDRDDRVPFLRRELVDRRHVLDARIVDEDVDGPELSDGLDDHRFDRGRVHHVGGVVAYRDAILLFEPRAQRFDFVEAPEAVQHDVRAGGRIFFRDAEPDAARGACDERGFTFHAAAG
jgi:hypothetical protein